MNNFTFWSTSYNFDVTIHRFRCPNTAELRNTFWLVRWDYRSQKTFENIIGDVIDSFGKTNYISPQSRGCLKTSNWDKYMSQSDIPKKLMSMMYFRFRHFAANSLRNLHNKQRKMNYYLPEKVLFDSSPSIITLWFKVWTGLKKIGHQSVSVHNLSFSQNV